MECPSPEILGSAIEGTRPDDVPPELVEHIGQCAKCQAILDELTQSIPRNWGIKGNSPETPADTLALSELQARATKLCGKKEALTVARKHIPEKLFFLKPTRRPGYIGRIGSYDVIEEIGRGGMGIVLKAHDPSLRRLVAIKVLAPELATSPVARQRFTREAHAAAAISDHDHVVTIYAIEVLPDELPFLVMQLIVGRSLEQRLRAEGPLETREALRIGLQTAKALAFAHSQGLIHRDVKPANILLENGIARAKLTDFGLARVADEPGMTRTGAISGTLEYMAPEQANGQRTDHRADLYSLGCVMYAMCVGRPPFSGKTNSEILRRLCEKEPTPITEFNEDIPKWFADIVHRLLNKDPRHRYQSAEELVKLLEGRLVLEQPPTIDTRPSSGSKASAHDRGVLPLSRIKLKWMLASIGLAAFAVAMVFFLFVDQNRFEPPVTSDSSEMRSGFTAAATVQEVLRTKPADEPLTIDLFTNIPIDASTLDLRGRKVRLRAGEGFSPVLQFSSSGGPLLVDSQLVVEGLLLRTNSRSQHEQPLIECRGQQASFSAANCRFEIAEPLDSCILLADGVEMSMVNCEVYSATKQLVQIKSTSGQSQQVALHNSVLAAQVVFSIHANQQAQCLFRLSGSSFSANQFMDFHEVGTAQVVVEADTSLFVVDAMFQAARPGIHQEFLEWTDRNNFFSIGSIYQLTGPTRVQRRAPNLLLWLNQVSTGSGAASFMGKALYKDGKLSQVTTLSDFSQLSPASFQAELTPSRNSRAGGLPARIGAALSSVGPALYFDWRRDKRSYKEWTKRVWPLDPQVLTTGRSSVGLGDN